MLKNLTEIIACGMAEYLARATGRLRSRLLSASQSAPSCVVHFHGAHGEARRTPFRRAGRGVADGG